LENHGGSSLDEMRERATTPHGGILQLYLDVAGIMRDHQVEKTVKLAGDCLLPYHNRLLHDHPRRRLEVAHAQYDGPASKH
jgi:hypothetical protein